MIVMEAALLIQPHCAQGRAYGPLSWGKRIAPAKSTWACCQTRLENSDAKGVKTCIITSGRIRIDRLFWWTAVTGVPYPFRPQMAKVQLRGCANRRVANVPKGSEEAELSRKEK